MKSPESLVRLPLASLEPHPLNPNHMPDELFTRLVENIRRTGKYPPVIVRSLGDGHQILDGFYRTQALLELGEETALCFVWPCSDEEALLLLATLNRLSGDDIPERRSQLIAALATHQPLADLARLLPEEEAQLESSLALLDFDLERAVAELTARAEAAARDLPVLFSFGVPAEHRATVEGAVEAAAARCSGSNTRGQALVLLAECFLRASE